MYRMALIFIWISFSITALTNVVTADEVILENGDKIS